MGTLIASARCCLLLVISLASLISSGCSEVTEDLPSSGNNNVRVTCSPTGLSEVLCGDGIDDDCNGFIDCDDLACEEKELCLAVEDEDECGQAMFQGGSLAIPDIKDVDYEAHVRIGGFLDGQKFRNITDIESVCVNMEHSWLRDLQIELECPSGQVLVLQKFLGTEGNVLHMGIPVDPDPAGQAPTPGTGGNYCWDDGAMSPSMLEWGTQNRGVRDLPEGDYQPYPLEDSSGMPLSESPMTSLVDCDLNGEWTFRVVDDWSSDNGYVFSWGINFDSSIVADCGGLVIE